MRYLSLVLLAFVFSCDDKLGSETTFLYEDGFENTGGDFLNLFPIDGSRWTNLQIVHPSLADSNRISLTQNPVAEGDYALKLVAKPIGDLLSKLDIEKQGFQAFIGQNIRIEADFYIEGNDILQSLFLIDLECCSCWDPDVPDNQCPGVRLQMSGGNDYLVMERGKILLPSISQTNFAFPRDQWVNVIWELQLSDEVDGFNSLKINGEEIISELGINMPNALAFADTLGASGFDFQLQQPLYYERIQIGATANASNAEVTMYIDNVSIEVKNN
ncbi:MAG: hypothetical protein ACI959_001917 [Limisphaerales bacterium]|jgi:hypothetical protein